MLVYLVNIALIILWRMFFTENRFRNPKKLYCGVVAFQWILISGLRGLRVGADTFTYYEWFERVKTLSWSDAFKNITNYLFRGLDIRDPGYELLMKVFQIFSGEYQLFLIGIAILFMSLMARFVYKYSASPCTSFIIFSTLFYSFYAVTGHRQTIATALIVFLGYDLIRERKIWKFAVVAFVSYLIHKSSVIFVPFYFLTIIPVTFIYKCILVGGIAVIAILGNRLYAPVAEALGFDSGVIDYTGGGAELFAVLLIALCVITWFFYPQMKNQREKASDLFHANALALLSACLVIQNQSFMRIQQYFSLFIMITVPELINLFKKEQRMTIYVAFGVAMILYLIGNDPYYVFFFMD